MLADEIMVVSDGQVLQSGKVPRRVPASRVGHDRSPARHRQPLRGRGSAPTAYSTFGDRVHGRHGWRPASASLRVCPSGARLLWHVPPEALRVRPDSSPPGANGSTVDLGPGRVTRHRRPRPHRRSGGGRCLRHRASGPDPSRRPTSRRCRLPGGDRHGGGVGLAAAAETGTKSQSVVT